MLKPEDLPAPETLVQYPDGSTLPVMFHYLDSDADLDAIAAENGFDFAILELEYDDSEVAEDLLERYGDGDNTVISEWNPEAPKGWFVAGKVHSDEGLVAFFLRGHAVSVAPTVDVVGNA